MERHAKGRTGPQRLYRSSSDRVIAGVAGGLAEYFDVDPVIIRVAFVLLTIFHGSGFIMYVILWLVIPDESDVSRMEGDVIQSNAEEMKEQVHHATERIRTHHGSGNSRVLMGAILVIVGLLFLGNNLGYLDITMMRQYWPLLLIAVGFLIFFKEDKGTKEERKLQKAHKKAEKEKTDTE